MNRIVFPLNIQTQGAAVGDLQDALRFLIDNDKLSIDDRLKNELLKSFSEERAQQLYGEASTLLLVKRFQKQYGLPESGEVDASSAEVLNHLLGSLGALDTAMYCVCGKVTSPDRALPAGLPVEILDKNVGSDVVLAETQTDAAGYYKASFGDSAFRIRGKEKPDVQARVRIGSATFVSEIRYNASADETLDILLPANVAELPSEYESLAAALAAHWREALSALQESDTRADITYLGNKTGWDARAVAMAALADKFSRAQDPNAPIPPELFYALFRAGLPADENTLYHVEANTLSRIWQQAVDQGVIPKSLAEHIPRMIERVQNVGVQKLLHGPALVGASTFTDMLAVANLSETQKQQFAQAYATHRGDLPTFWNVVKEKLGQDGADRLQLHGKLAFLTINNAPLMRQLDGKGTPLQLARAGYHRSEKWATLLTDSVPIPPEIPGETEAVKRENYATHLGAQLRLSYPTAALAELIESQDLRVELHAEVSQFLTDHMGEFEIGVHPIDQYIARNRLDVKPDIENQVRRLQRVYQITKTDKAMGVLLEKRMDAAYHIAQLDRGGFVETFGEQLGGREAAAQIHDRATQVHAAVLNIAVSYLTARNGVPLGKAPLQAGETGINGQVLQPVPKRASVEDAASVIAYPTLEGLFGSMDFCACEECRSILSPAAYLVDLLQFIDKAADGKQNAQTVLLGRRPDIQFLPLTCENTNTQLPYIDLVNETLEYFVANAAKPKSLEGYQGHDTGATASEDLLASPQYVNDAAYNTMKSAWFPPPLPFNQTLERQRRYFNRLDVPLQSAMEQLCPIDDLERGTYPYGWRDILMEELGLSRQEHQLLTDSTLTWKQVFGFDQNKPDNDVLGILSNAKLFARRVGITYEELVALLKTRFVNPNVNLIPKLERLGVPFATIQALHDGRLSEPEFNALLPTGAGAPDPAQYGGNIAAWIKNEQNYGRIRSIITLTGTGGGGDCDFGRFELGFGINSPAPELVNASFEVPSVGKGIKVRPTDAGVRWIFEGECGIQGNGSDFHAPAAPADSQTAFMHHLGINIIHQWLYFAPGNYALRFQAARSDSSSNIPVIAEISAVETGGPLLAHTVIRPTTSFTDFTIDFTVTLYRYYDVRFIRSDLTAGDTTAFIDAVTITRRLGPLDFVRLLRFIRLWEKTGWTIEQTDAAICAVIDPATVATEEQLDAAFLTLLPRLGIVKRVMRELELSPGRDLLALLACWSDIGTHGDHALYRQMFLNPTILKQDPAFADNGYGEFLTDPAKHLLDHVEALRGAFNLTGDEFNRIVQELQYNSDTLLTLPNISSIFRCGWLSRKLGLSVLELYLLSFHTGLDPFAMFNIESNAKFPTKAMRFIPFVQALKARSMKPATALYLIWDQDISGRSAPDPAQIVELARSLRSDFATIEGEFAVAENPGSNTFRARLALVYGQETSDAFYAHLENTLELGVPYTHPKSSLEPEITSVDPDLTYDTFQHRLSHIGIMSTAQQNDLKAVAGVSDEFKRAVDDVFNKCKQVRDSFFLMHPELRPLYDAYALADTGLTASVGYTHPSATLEPAITAADPHLQYDNINKKLSRKGVMIQRTREALTSVGGVSPEFQAAVSGLFNQGQSSLAAFFSLVATFQGKLADKRKREQALQRLAAAAGTDLQSTRALLDPALAPGSIYPLHAATDRNQPVLNDVLAVETPGLGAEFYFRDTAGGDVNLHVPAEANLDYSETNGHPLPKNPNAGAAISGIWSGALEVPETGPYNIVIAADNEAAVTLKLDGKDKPLTKDGTLWRNKELLELKAETIHDIILQVEKVKSVFSVKWESQKQRLQVIPGHHLYPRSVLPPFRDAFVRFLKIVTLASNLELTATEIAYLATNAEDPIDNEVWLNAIPTEGILTPEKAKTLQALREPLWGLLDFARIKADWSPDDERVLAVLKDPSQATEAPDSLLFKLSRWNKTSLEKVLEHFGKTTQDLSKLRLFRRIYEAFVPIQRIAIPASKLISATTNDPSSDAVRDFQAALRARFDAASWRDVIRPINDTLRGLQRDALVASILHQLRENPNTAHIDTADKLFEYFLMDVEMDPCMQTSRIRNALSTVQLFIERCLMNLEPEISPRSIDASKWTWMKRYRIWEANRKVFLFPENWLEPELRDDKSPFFKEIETQLLQSDITNDSAAGAMLDYLAKLDEVARLEPCGMCHDEKGTEDKEHTADDVVHVVARTTGAHRVYYYRRYELGSWTPWEQIRLDIEDNPVIPVVWKNRLLLLWLRTIKQVPQTLSVPQPSLDNTKLAELTVPDLSAAVKNNAADNLKQSVGAVLHWSEYDNGKWQTVRTSDINAPMHIGDFSMSGTGAFDRSALDFFTFNLKDGNLIAIVKYGKWDLDRANRYFVLDNAQRARIGDPNLLLDDLLDVRNHLYLIRFMDVHDGILWAVHKSGNSEDERGILSFKTSGSWQRGYSDLRSDWWGPFLFGDFQYTYWVTVSDSAPSVKAYLDYGIALTPVGVSQAQIPALGVGPFPVMGAEQERNGKRIGFNKKVGAAGRAPLAQIVTPKGYRSATITYGSRRIGPWGAIS